MDAAEILFSEEIRGVFEARQKRSVRIRDSFINAGVEALNEMRFVDLKISVLAASSGNSVGSFYTRFQDKDAFFRALRVFAIKSLEHREIARFRSEIPIDRDPKQVLDNLVDLMGDIFTSRFRGVLRESLLRILEPNDPWAPMRVSAHNIVTILHENLANSFAETPEQETKTRLSFCFQMIVGVLQNELVNDYHVFTTRDESLRNGLKEAVCAYMCCQSNGEARK